MRRWLSAFEVRATLHSIGISADEDAVLLVTDACLRRGLVASGFEYQLVEQAGLPSRRINSSDPARALIIEPFWRVFDRVERSDQCWVHADWQKGHFYFELDVLGEQSGSVHRRAFQSVMFDQAGIDALVEHIRAGKGFREVTDAERLEWVARYGADYNSKSAFAAFQIQIGKERAGRRKSFDLIYTQNFPRKRGNQGTPRLSNFKSRE